MDKMPSMPPNIQIPDIPKLTEKELQSIDWEKAQQHPAIQKRKKRLEEQRKREAAEKLEQKKERRSEWWKTNAIGIVTLIVALATLIVTVLK